jgi:hypothetical protein
MGMFNKANVSSTVIEKPKKGQKVEVNIEGAGDLAAINALITALEGMKAGVEEQVKTQIRDRFEAEGNKMRVRPENFKGIDVNAVVSCELRKRSTKSVLSASEVETLKKDNIPFDRTIVKQGCFFIN